jgi:hypothetical protein
VDREIGPRATEIVSPPDDSEVLAWDRVDMSLNGRIEKQP